METLIEAFWTLEVTEESDGVVVCIFEGFIVGIELAFAEGDGLSSSVFEGFMVGIELAFAEGAVVRSIEGEDDDVSSSCDGSK